MTMSSLHISLSYIRSFRSVGDSMRKDPQDSGPGWFLRATENDGYENVVKYVRVDPARVMAVADLLDAGMPESYREGRKINGPLAMAVNRTNVAHVSNAREARERAERQIEQAREVLARLDAEGK